MSKPFADKLRGDDHRFHLFPDDTPTTYCGKTGERINPELPGVDISKYPEREKFDPEKKCIECWNAACIAMCE